MAKSKGNRIRGGGRRKQNGQFGKKQGGKKGK